MQNSYVIYAVKSFILYIHIYVIIVWFTTTVPKWQKRPQARATYCFGCGNEVKPENRRKLDNEEAKNVVLVWKAFLEDEGHLIGEDVSLDAILNGEDSQRPLKMCRKCFNGYKKYFEFHQTIKQKLTKAIEVLELSPCSTLPLPSSSRPKKSRSLSWPTREQLP